MQHLHTYTLHCTLNHNHLPHVYSPHTHPSAASCPCNTEHHQHYKNIACLHNPPMHSLTTHNHAMQHLHKYTWHCTLTCTHLPCVYFPPHEPHQPQHTPATLNIDHVTRTWHASQIISLLTQDHAIPYTYAPLPPAAYPEQHPSSPCVAWLVHHAHIQMYSLNIYELCRQHIRQLQNISQ